jgi:hypothetical protein
VDTLRIGLALNLNGIGELTVGAKSGQREVVTANDGDTLLLPRRTMILG